MFDFDLHMRFMRSATDALFQGVAAAMAASAAWQDQTMTGAGFAPEPKAPSIDPFNPMSWWLAALPPPPKPSPTPYGFAPWALAAPWLSNPWMKPGFGAASIPSPFSSWSSNWVQPWTAVWGPFGGQFGHAPDPQNVTQAMQAFWSWPSMPWTLWQMPLTAMMMSAGMPYAVASPAARASAASLDAMDAARQQTMNVFSAYRSDGRHASAQIITWPLLLGAAIAPVWDATVAMIPALT